MTCRTIAGLGLCFHVFLCGGCGTVMNLEDPPKSYFRRYPGTDANKVYGGVRIDAEQGCNKFDFAPFDAMYLLAIDLPLSAVADTITLPWTISAEVNRLISNYYFPKQQAKSDAVVTEAPQP
ncbi:MAG TPA: YceK/YidQ family lipoprotein [Bryobacteraceae bacterium]|jgi:uncharacterized protein YceK